MSSLKGKILSTKDSHFTKKTEPSEEKSLHFSDQHDPTSGSNHEMREFLELFREFIVHAKSGSGGPAGGGASELEPRDRAVEVALPAERGN
jgi:hypothetical protein